MLELSHNVVGWFYLIVKEPSYKWRCFFSKVEENKRLSRTIQTTLKEEKARVEEGISADKSKSKKR
jgi:hypothetical protein